MPDIVGAHPAIVGAHPMVLPPTPSEHCSNPAFLLPDSFLWERSTPRMHFLTSWLKKCTHSSHYCSFLHFIKKPDRPFHNNLLAQSQFLLITIINLSVFPSSEVLSEMKGEKCREKNGESGSSGDQDPVGGGGPEGLVGSIEWEAPPWMQILGEGLHLALKIWGLAIEWCFLSWCRDKGSARIACGQATHTSGTTSSQYWLFVTLQL